MRPAEQEAHLFVHRAEEFLAELHGASVDH